MDSTHHLDRQTISQAARLCLQVAQEAVDVATAKLQGGDIDANQAVAYDLANAASMVRAAKTMQDYATLGEVETRLAGLFTGETLANLIAASTGRESNWGLEPGWHARAQREFSILRSTELAASLADQPGTRGLDEDFELVRETFHRFAQEQIRPHAEEVHRKNLDVPESVIEGLASLGGFGLSVPEEYGGAAQGGEHDYLAMVVATEELSWGSLGIGGSLVTRPEILTRALVNFGTEDQRRRWLSRIASGEIMVAVAVTEPDYGSDVANLTTMATMEEGGWRISGVKTWCTFAARADVLMLLARTDPDRSRGHRGLSLFVVPKPRGDGHGFSFTQEADGGTPAGGKLEGRPIDTIGYRGMHSYELSLDGWWVPDDALVGGNAGLNKGFYAQMQGFENGRLQTAARALGVMQAAYEAAAQYAAQRWVFGHPIQDYQLTQIKLGRMAALIQAGRQFAFEVAKLMAKGEGTLEASMVKAFVCKAAEWVTREAMQIHGGMGYAEEFSVSRYFVDARVLSIFEGADETLALRVIAKRLLS
jgi:(2S)-methylsuccinyl-CoA dehydrogenase